MPPDGKGGSGIFVDVDANVIQVKPASLDGVAVGTGGPTGIQVVRVDEGPIGQKTCLDVDETPDGNEGSGIFVDVDANVIQVKPSSLD